MQRVPGFLATYSRLINKRSTVIKTKKYKGGNSIDPHSTYICDSERRA